MKLSDADDFIGKTQKSQGDPSIPTDTPSEMRKGRNFPCGGKIIV